MNQSSPTLPTDSGSDNEPDRHWLDLDARLKPNQQRRGERSRDRRQRKLERARMKGGRP
jgi:hypothetical protein